MNEYSPCMGCDQRHPTCHGSCEKYLEWRDRYHAQQKHLEDNRHRFDRPWSESREKGTRSFLKFGPGSQRGGLQ